MYIVSWKQRCWQAESGNLIHKMGKWYLSKTFLKGGFWPSCFNVPRWRLLKPHILLLSCREKYVWAQTFTSAILFPDTSSSAMPRPTRSVAKSTWLISSSNQLDFWYNSTYFWPKTHLKMINYYDKNRFISKSMLARLADVSPRFLSSPRPHPHLLGLRPHRKVIIVPQK